MFSPSYPYALEECQQKEQAPRFLIGIGEYQSALGACRLLLVGLGWVLSAVCQKRIARSP